MTRQSLIDKLRLGPWLIAAILMAIIVGLLYPHQLGVLLWSLTKLSFGAYLGYWIDRSLFPYARPHELFSQASALGESGATREERALTRSRLRREASFATLRRAIIIAAALIALGLGV